LKPLKIKKAGKAIKPEKKPPLALPVEFQKAEKRGFNVKTKRGILTIVNNMS